MFNRKKCPRCGRKISKEYDFCPYCGNDFRWEKGVKKERDYGFLGVDDFTMPNLNIKMPLSFSSLFNSLFNEVERQFKELDKQMAQGKKEKFKFKKLKKIPGASGISISISSSGGGMPEIKVNTFGDEFKDLKFYEKETTIKKPEISDEQARKFAKLPKKEAKTEVRRLSNKIVYEINLPGIKNLKNVIINKLENSIEIKAFSDKTAYFKLIPLSLPILNYKLNKEKLILELAPRQ